MKKDKKNEFSNCSEIIKQKSERYAMILAGGDGTRLKNLTRAILGDERPKQFCPILNEETLLTMTQKRVGLKIKSENTFYSLTKKHEKFYQPLLANLPNHQLIVQPENKGTAPAILYSLLRLAKIAPEATVAFFPSDHYFSDDAAFMNNVESAFEMSETNPRSIFLLGIEPEKPEPSYGWIEPVESVFGNLSKSVSRVKHFWEKPSVESAKTLMLKGCLWNSFVMIGKVETFLNLFQKHLPDLYKMFAATNMVYGTYDERSTMRSLYAWINEANFSSEVLEKCTDELFVVRVGDVGWSDWGEPNRVIGTLSKLGVRFDWMKTVPAYC
jgi:mannose-1-phosphate guanylyltransferase